MILCHSSLSSKVLWLLLFTQGVPPAPPLLQVCRIYDRFFCFFLETRQDMQRKLEEAFLMRGLARYVDAYESVPLDCVRGLLFGWFQSSWVAEITSTPTLRRGEVGFCCLRFGITCLVCSACPDFKACGAVCRAYSRTVAASHRPGWLV